MCRILSLQPRRFWCILLVMIAWSAVAVAQFRDGDRDRDRGRDRDGGRDEGRREEFRGPPPMFGGGFGPPGGFNPADMLRRLDENNNGLIDPDESDGRARFFLERFARDVPGIDFSRPIPIDRLSQAMQQRMREGSGRSDENQGSRDSSSSSRGTNKVEPLVPGFGVEESLPLPLPFGVRGEVFSVKTSDEDRREAEERLRRYDENRDGTLDREEVSRNRWSDDPFVYDQNRDGKLSVAELAVRYARRRADENNSRASSSGSGGSSSRGPSPSPSNSPPTPGASPGGDPRAEMMVRFMFERYDRNRSGILEKDEWSGFRTDPSAADTNKDSKITREELAAWAPTLMSSGGFGRGGPPGGFAGPPGGFGGGGEGERFAFRRDDDDRRDGDRREGDRRDSDRREGDRSDSGNNFFSRRSSDSKSSSSSDAQKNNPYRALSPTERLPKGLPEWFARNDGNADGQVAMAEYSSSWSDSTSREFNQFDLNQDGFITPKECLKATDQGVVRGASGSSGSSSSSSRSAASFSSSGTNPSGSTRNSNSASSLSSSARDSAPAAQSNASESAATSESKPATGAPATDVKVDSRMLVWAQGFIKKYDTNGDGALEKSEWSSMSKNPEAADTNSDGKISPDEYAVWTLKK